MFQKRGQEGVTLTTLILIIIGAVVAVVIILGATGVLNKIFGSGDALPKNLQLITEACELDAKQTLISDYCYTFKEADDNQYINCQDARVQNALKQQGVAVTGIICDSTLVEDAVKNICTGLSTTQKDKAIFNDRKATGDNDVLSCESTGVQTPNTPASDAPPASNPSASGVTGPS